MHALIIKADDPHEQAKEQFKQLLAEESVPMRRAFQQYVDSVLESVTDAQIRQWVENKDLQGFLRVAADHIDEMSDVLPETFVRNARAEIANLAQPGKFGVGKLNVEFDTGASSAVDLAESNRLSFLRDFTASQKDTVRSAISDSLSAGEGPAAAARRFRSAIGLTENQYRAVQNYQKLLENTSKGALDRALRDARYDRTIVNAIENDNVLSAKQIEKMVGRYTENMRNYRAMVIARTETMRVLNQAKQEAWAQTAEQLGIKPGRVEKIWITTLDGKERDTHHDMDRQTVVGLDTPFESPSGEELVYPGDPAASAEETVQCRCTVVVRFPPPPRMIGKAFNPDQPRDKDGKWTAVGYHGTASDFDEPEANEPVSVHTGNKDLKGIYFSGDERSAWGYANIAGKRPGAGRKRVITANLEMKNPLNITNSIKRGQKKGLSFGDAKRAAMKELTPEHDGVVFNGNSMNPPEYVVFHHSQIHRIVKA